MDHKRVLVYGAGKSGLAAARLLCQDECNMVSVTDTRDFATLSNTPVLRQVGVTLTPFERLIPADYDVVVLSPGVPVDDAFVIQARAAGAKILGEVELASFHLAGEVIGITGSNGKTTTTAMTGHILKHAGVPCQVGGNIGVPLTALVETSKPNQWNVLELSSFQLETINHFSARIALVLNLTPDHLDRHHTFEQYVGAKRRLLETQVAKSSTILNADDPACVALEASVKGETFWFSSRGKVAAGSYSQGGMIWIEGEQLMETSAIPVPGEHNVQNAMAAAMACYLAGATRSQIADALASFPGVEHRIEFTREVRGVRYYNDSKATNVDATLKAIAAFPGRLWVILGGKDKASDYTLLRQPLREKAHAALLIGSAALKIEHELGGAVAVEQCGTLERAVEHAHAHAKNGDVVLLAPACASFDQFQNFEQRGETFKALVKALPE